jgi:hypothetical protein
MSAFDKRLTAVGDDILALAVKLDAAALYCLGRFLLWDLDDPASALPYLKTATARGSVEAALDFAVLALFRPANRS